MANPQLKIPPDYCQYAAGPCDQQFTGVAQDQGIFLYPSKPEHIAATIESGVEKIRQKQIGCWQTWREFDTAGQIIFCTICKKMRFSDAVIADVTTLNFNLLFEFGFGLGLELPVLPIRDTTVITDKRDFEELGLLDTIGYLDFQNSDELASRFESQLPIRAIPGPPDDIKNDTPLYVLKGPINTEGTVVLMSTLKKSGFRFRTHDVLENPRLSLHEARKQVAASLGVIAHLLSSDRVGARVHNARCALIAGLAMATRRAVLLLQEGNVQQPIDYRDVVASYTTPNQIPSIFSGFVPAIVSRFQEINLKTVKRPARFLERLDLGDIAAENEIRPLQSYFLRTGQYNEAIRGHARLVVGRKGGGKTAIFYAVRDNFWNRKSHLVLDLKPEGHQFIKLREVVLSKLSPGLQEHTLTAFWNVILLSEIAHKIAFHERTWALNDHERYRRYKKVNDVYLEQGFAETGDLSERLLRQVDRIAETYRSIESEPTAAKVTELLFTGSIKELNAAVAEYLCEKDEVWFLFDNLDKGWPTGGAKFEDILIIRSLLSATRKLQREFEDLDIELHCLVFLRNDIYEILVQDTADRGKDTAIDLAWNDAEGFQEMVRLRIHIATGKVGPFMELWHYVFASHVGGQSSFEYIVERTLMRPRDVLNFLHRSIEVALNRGHDHVTQEDIQKAEERYSEDILVATIFELKDVSERGADFIYEFLGCPERMPKEQVYALLRQAEIAPEKLDEVLRLILWFGFLGVEDQRTGEPRYAFQMGHDVNKLLISFGKHSGAFVIHPAFRKALECVPTDT